MNEFTASDEAVIDELVRYVLAWTGYRPDPSHGEAVRRAIRVHRQNGVTMAQLLERAARGEPALMSSLLSAVSVPETYFFRHPEHFEWIAREVVTRLLPGQPVRAWSAGCATGEEAFSLAACLLATVPQGTHVEVIGTDLIARNLEIARLGIYGRWSHRTAGPLLYPVCRTAADGRTRVLDPVREVTGFMSHNLLDPPPGLFDVVVCRNVLLYFTAQATRTATEHLRAALKPGAVLFFGTLDISGIPEGLTRLGRPELNVFTLAPTPLPTRARRRSTVPPPRKSVRPPPAERIGAPGHVALHLRALSSIEHGDRRRAQRELAELRRLAPDYLPGLFEQAILHIRHGDDPQARLVMGELVERLDLLAGDVILAGPEDLPVDYYRVAARAFLKANDRVKPGQGGCG